MHIDSDKCRLCRECVEGVMHLALEWQMLASNEYLKRNDNVIKVLMTTRVVEKELLEKGWYWQKLKWVLGAVVENDKTELCWNFEYRIKN